MEVTRGSYEISDWLWLTCNERVTLLTIKTATIGDRSLAWNEAISFEFVDALKKRIDLYQADQPAVDAFFGPEGCPLGHKQNLTCACAAHM
jgi:hypothetical protein